MKRNWLIHIWVVLAASGILLLNFRVVELGGQANNAVSLALLVLGFPLYSIQSIIRYRGIMNGGCPVPAKLSDIREPGLWGLMGYGNMRLQVTYENEGGTVQSEVLGDFRPSSGSEYQVGDEMTVLVIPGNTHRVVPVGEKLWERFLWRHILVIVFTVAVVIFGIYRLYT